MSERHELIKEISDLKSLVEETKNTLPVTPTNSLLRGEETGDIISMYYVIIVTINNNNYCDVRREYTTCK